MTYEVCLDVYRGPFDLLLSVIAERKLDVCAVPIAKITEDYLAHLARMQELDLEVTTGFLVVAAQLLALKARALLPTPTEPEGPEERAERDVLIARLLEVRTFRAAGEYLAELLAAGDRFYPPSPAPDDPALRLLPTLAGIDAEAMARALVESLQGRARPIDTSLLVGDVVPVEDAVALIYEQAARGPVTFRHLAASRGVSWAVALFVALLELAARGEVELGQAELLGDIEIRLAGGGVR